MQSEIKDNEKFENKKGLPVLDTPHFNDEEIAQAQPVQPLAQLSQRRSQRRSRPRAIIVVAMIVAGLVVTSAFALGFAGSNSLLQSTSDDGAASGQIVSTEQPVTDDSQDVSAKNETRADQRRKSSSRRFERPQLIIRFGAGDDRRPKARLVSVIQ